MARRVPQQFIDDVLSRTDIVELIDFYLPLKKTGQNYSCLCPFHSEKSPSFTVSPNKQFFHCFGCGASGNALSFLMQYENLDFLDAVEFLANQVGLSLPQAGAHYQDQASTNLFQIVEDSCHFFQEQLSNAQQARDYLYQNRGLSAATLEHFQIGYAPPHWEQLLRFQRNKGYPLEALQKTGLVITNQQGHSYDRFRDRIMFPIRDRKGRVVGFGGRLLKESDKQPKYLNSPETALFHKSYELYGLYEARKSHPNLSRLIIVEGYMDVIALAEHQITNCVATLGTAVTAKHLHRLLRTADALTFCFDGDQAGQNAAWKALKTALPLVEDRHQINIALLPNDLDPDDYVKQFGQQAFLQAIEQGATLADYLLEHFKYTYNLETVSGCANFVAAIMPHVQQINATMTRELLIKQVAKLSGSDIDQLRQAYPHQYASSTTYQTSSPNRSPSVTTVQQTPVRKAIALLIQHPYLANSVDHTLPGSDLPGLKILTEILNLLQNNEQNWTTGQLLEHWRGRDEAQHLARLAQAELLLSENQLKTELQASLERIQQLACQHRIDELIHKSRSNQLDRDEQQELQQLLSQHKP